MSSHAGGEVPGLAAGRLWAASHFPYLASGLFGAQVLAKPGIATVAVDEGWRLHADPELTATWTPPQLGSVLVHHVSHLLRAHGERAVAAGIIPDDARAWVRGADAEINDDLVPAGLELPGQPVLPGHLGAEEGLLAEQYFVAGRSGEPGRRRRGRRPCGRPLGPGLRQRRGRLAARLGRLRAARALPLAGPAALSPGGPGMCPARAGGRERACRAAALGGADSAARGGLAAGARGGIAPGRGRHGGRGRLLLPAALAPRLGGLPGGAARAAAAGA